MKPILLAVSLLANAALVAAFASKPALVPPSFRDYFTFGSGSPSSSSSSASATKSPAAAPKRAAATATSANNSGHIPLWSALQTDDLRALVERLRAGGFPIYLIRAILQHEISARYDARMRELTQGDPNSPFWKPTTSLGMDSKRMAEYTALTRERSNLLKSLLGNFAWRDDGSLTTADARRYGNLPQSKIEQIDRINADYAELNNQVRAAMNGITLPEDREKLALLEREKRADLVALLSPEELADYDMRNSPVTNRLRPALTLLNATEEEFRTIFNIQQAFNDQINPTNLAAMTPQERTNLMQQRTAAQAAMDAQLKAALGDARFAEFTRASDRDYQQLAQLEQRQNLPPGTAAQAYDLRNALSQESNRIFNDNSLGYDQKIAALQTLAQNTRTQLASTLGSAGDAYLKSASWLSAVERGSAVTFSGTSTSIRSLPNPNGGGFRTVTSTTSSSAGGTAGAVSFSGGTLFVAPSGTAVVAPGNSSVIINTTTNASGQPTSSSIQVQAVDPTK